MDRALVSDQNFEKEMKSVTQIIDNELEILFRDFADKEIEKVLSLEDKEKLADFFQVHSMKMPSFGDYIYMYIYETTDLKNFKKKYTDISEDVYYGEYILPSFRNRLGKARASLNPDSKETLSTKKGLLNGTKQPVRGDVFLFAFGLGMDVDTVTLMLKKCLMEDDFDMKNYKEVIYYWCLKEHLPYTAMLRYLRYYEDLKQDLKAVKTDVDMMKKKETLLFSNQLKHMLTGEDAFLKYLLTLKSADEESLRKKSAKKVLKELFRGFPKAVEGEVELNKFGMTEKEILDEDNNYATDLNIEKRIRVLNQLKKSNFEKNEEELLPDGILAAIFKNLSFTKKSMNNRFYNTTPVSRIELLTAEFIVYMVGILDDEKDQKRFETGNDSVTFVNRQASWIDFSEIATNTLKDVGMQGFYVRNPYDLFLVYCILHKDPFAYFMASWEKGERLRGQQKDAD